MMARGKPWTDAELKLLMDMAAQGFNPQQIFDSGKLPGRTLRAIGKQAYCSIVRTFPTAIVHTIEPASDALSMEEVVRLFSTAFKQICGARFNIQLLGSEKYVLNKLQTLGDESQEKVREAFIKHCHTRFMKYFFPHLLFGHKKDYVEEIMKASLERLARLIKVCGFLLQTKVYLFWKNLNV